MNLMKLEYKSNLIYPFIVVFVYAVLTVLSMNNCYFWDNIQQISKEAHWFYQTDFRSLLIPAQNFSSEIIATGYHPPLMGIMTAGLWKIFGYKLWVSHVFSFLWALVLIYNGWKLLLKLLPENIAAWALFIVMFESTLLAQFSIASPDFILFTAFIISLRAVLEHKKVLLTIAVFFLCSINMRGIFVGAILFLVHSYYTFLQSEKKASISSYLKIIIPYLPTILILAGYFSYYFTARGWFFSESSDSNHYALPTGINQIIKHLAEFGLRSVENGRIIIWAIGIYVAVNIVKTKRPLKAEYKTILLFFLLLTGLYVVFIFTTQMPFSARYFMPQFFLLTLLVLLKINKLFCFKKNRIYLIAILLFELSGNFWIYPDRIAKSWDCTLAHLPYYDLREKCFNYIDQQKLDYKDISGGFCLYGNRRFIEMTKEDKTVGTDTNRKYFIYSNISNIDDSFAEELKNKAHWIPIKVFEKGFVNIIIYQNLKCRKN